MGLSREWPNSRNIQKELSWYDNPVKSYGRNRKNAIFWPFLADFPLSNLIFGQNVHRFCGSLKNHLRAIYKLSLVLYWPYQNFKIPPKWILDILCISLHPTVEHWSTWHSGQWSGWARQSPSTAPSSWRSWSHFPSFRQWTPLAWSLRRWCCSPRPLCTHWTRTPPHWRSLLSWLASRVI